MDPLEPKSESGHLYIALFSIHGLIRGERMELGRDADTGGQVKYVVELARALARHNAVERVDLFTRLVSDPKVASGYAEPIEELAPGARIVRLSCGPQRYLRKEVLWPYLDSFVDQALRFFRSIGRLPDFIHGHYADAGYVGSTLAGLLGVPMAFTGHSLGRVKRKRLLEQGLKESAIETQYNIQQRIEAEERALDHAAFVVASTRQEVEEQYALYDNYEPRRMLVIPPGTELERFFPPPRDWRPPPIQEEIDRFLREPGKPVILALSRPDPRKNIGGLLRAYGNNRRLRELANLVIVAGNRDDIESMEKGPRGVLTELLLFVDRYDLYGSVAYPKHHEAAAVPDIYRLAARRRGVFVNPALTEPFGLTLIEAAACGLPSVATNDGGPRDILGYCQNGLLVDPFDEEALASALLSALSDRERWRRWSRNGARGAHQHFSWTGHVDRYLRAVRSFVERRRRRVRLPVRNPLPTAERLLVTDIDNTLLGDPDGLAAFAARLRALEGRLAFGVATGRSLKSATTVLKKWKLPPPTSS